MILGHGIDLVEVARVTQMVERHGDHLLERVFTADELAYCRTSQKRLYEHLAGRFAAKEAILKALGTGWSGGIRWTDMQVVRGQRGEPGVCLTGRCLEVAQSMGVCQWHLSISHIESFAMASAIAWGGPDAQHVG